MMLSEERKQKILDSIYTTDTGKGKIYAKTPSAQLKKIVPFLNNYRSIYELANISSMPCLNLEEDSDEIIAFLLQEIVYLKIICDDEDFQEEETVTSTFGKWVNKTYPDMAKNLFSSEPRHHSKWNAIAQQFMR